MRNVRIFYTKKGRMKFVSHLDMNRFMSRLIAKSKIPVWYTEGFNQHIYINYAVPLSLGFEGEYEVMDIKICDDTVDLEDILDALRKVSVEGVEFLKIAECKEPMKEIGFAEYVITFDGMTDDIADKIKEFFNRRSIICQKTTKKGGTKDIDIIPNIKKAQLSENRLNLVLTCGNEDNLNPTLVMSAFFDLTDTKPLHYSVLRTMIFDKLMQCFE